MAKMILSVLISILGVSQAHAFGPMTSALIQLTSLKTTETLASYPEDWSNKWVIVVHKEDQLPEDKRKLEYLELLFQVSKDPSDVKKVLIFDNLTSNRSLVSTANPVRYHGLTTPNGIYSITWLDRDHHSNLYGTENGGEGAPMPFAMNINGPFWLHGDPDEDDSAFGSPQSHGCIRVKDEEILYKFVQAAGEENFVVVIGE